VNGALDRADNFRPDPMVRTGSATLDDYKGSGYDRGHLCPAADQKWSAEAMDDSFYLSNMSPQASSFNRGIWSSLEAMVRTFANDNGSIYIATGPVLSDGPYKTIGKDKVAVPKQYYKAILVYDGTNAEAIGFLLPNEGSDKPVKSFATSIDQVENVTGIDFFPKLPDDTENSVEASFDTTKWNWREYTSGDTAKTLITKSDQEKKRDNIKQVILVVCDELRTQILVWLKSL
jgi:endonuclease G